MNKTFCYAMVALFVLVLSVMGWNHFSSEKNVAMIDSTLNDSIEVVDSVINTVVNTTDTVTVDSVLKK